MRLDNTEWFEAMRRYVSLSGLCVQEPGVAARRINKLNERVAELEAIVRDAAACECACDAYRVGDPNRPCIICRARAATSPTPTAAASPPGSPSA